MKNKNKKHLDNIIVVSIICITLGCAIWFYGLGTGTWPYY